MPCEKLLDYLDEHAVPFTLIKHSQAFTAQEVAERAHVSGKEFAKTVMVKLDGDMAMAVLPAENRVSFNLLREAADAETVSLAPEGEFKDLFPDCELGAMPPFGHLYGMAVHVDGSLAEREHIVFNAGTHTELIKLSYHDFARLVQPRISRFTFRGVRELKGKA